MNSSTQPSITAATVARLNAAIPLAIMSVVLMMVLSIPSYLLDLLISVNITLSVITLVASMYITLRQASPREEKECD